MSRFTRVSLGCHADGAFGHGHVRITMARMLERLGHATLASELRAPMSDDASEEDEALEVLNAECEPGIRFGFVHGDLMLQTDAWWESFE